MEVPTMAFRSGGPSRTGTTEHRRWARQVKARDRWRCRRCGFQGSATAKPADVEADHVIPIAEGGAEFDLANGQTLCRRCHRAKTEAEAARGRAARSPRRPRPVHPSRRARPAGGPAGAPPPPPATGGH
ncbi:HNH endonuclease [Rhodococcus rhodnii]|uniref:HNH endonuclease n=2 Tax=Rhodococcus rhodnii TaxID=38312 RepID=A0A6P2C944_9NOCA|nr:HNH endonuclease [Rhodococcus rhodnii]TXG89055.1 HNH endonuclease [Rhodococcus rhodnii]